MFNANEVETFIKSTRFFLGESGLLTTNIPVLKSISIRDINWQIRFYHTLQIINQKKVIENLEQLLNTHFEEFLMVRNCGTTTIEQARQTIINFLLSSSTKIELRDYEEVIKETEEKRKFVKSYPFSERLSIPFESLKKYLNISLQEFEFPIRFNKYVTTINNVLNLKELLSIDPQILIQKRNIGRKTIIDVSKRIDEKIKRLELGLEKVEEKNIVVIINNILNKISDRELTILKMRWAGKDEISLEEIGSHFGLTRERIRQIIQRITDKIWTRIEDRADYYREIFLDYIINKPEPITEKILCSDSHELKYTDRLYLGLLAEIFQEIPFYDFMPLAFDQYFSRQIENNPSWATIHDVLRRLKVGHKEITPPELREILESQNLDFTQQLLCFKILFGLKKYFFFKEGDQYYLLRKGSIREMTYVILKNSETPLNIEKIMTMIHKYYYEGLKYDSLNSVIGNIKQDERIIQFDRYVFGTEKHFAYQKKEWDSICLHAKSFMKKMKRQCYITEILEALCDGYPDIKSKYELVHILRTDNEINDLGFFNFTLISYRQGERIKVCDLIKDIFEKDAGIKHVHDIKKELKRNRFVHDQGMSALLKSQKYLKNYPGGFYGLRRFDKENEVELTRKEKYLEYIVNQYFFPNTDIENIIEYFNSEEIQQEIISTIKTSKAFQIYTLENGKTCVINNNWSNSKKVKCLLSNINEPVFEEQLEWMLKDLGANDFKKDLYKIRGDRSITYSNNKYNFNRTSLIKPELTSLIDECFDFISDSSKPYYLQDIFELICSSESGIEHNQFVSALKEDERFIVMDNNLVLIK
ncbi:MAG: hypothetical protein M1495_12770 [Bacteroidetes bacterium]|nr:hypothetical protein [Bacteroidota bacterium]